MKKITDKVSWVGKVDWELRRFHGNEYSTEKGSSYNAYLIRDKKTALIDTVWGPYDKENMICRFVTSWATKPEELDYLEENL